MMRRRGLGLASAASSQPGVPSQPAVPKQAAQPVRNLLRLRPQAAQPIIDEVPCIISLLDWGVDLRGTILIKSNGRWEARRVLQIRQVGEGVALDLRLPLSPP